MFNLRPVLCSGGVSQYCLRSLSSKFQNNITCKWDVNQIGKWEVNYMQIERRRVVVIITTTQLDSTTSELRWLCAGSNPVCDLSENRDGEDHSSSLSTSSSSSSSCSSILTHFMPKISFYTP